MKKILFSFAILFPALWLANADAAYHSFEYAAGLPSTQAVDKTQLEGWVVSVDYHHGSFRLLDPRGFERSITVRPGTIGGYRRGDHVKVSLDRDREWMSTVEKL